MKIVVSIILINESYHYGVLNEDWILKNIKNENIKNFLLPTGSVVIADTSGLHKGQYCLNKPRELLQITVSPSNISSKNETNKFIIKNKSNNMFFDAVSYESRKKRISNYENKNKKKKSLLSYLKDKINYNNL